MREQTANRVFDTANFIVLLVSTLICLAPFLHIIAISMSSAGPILSGKVNLLPVEFNIEAYAKVFSDASMIRSLGFTVLLTGLTTVLCMLMTIAIGYPMSKKKLRGRKAVMFVIVVTMFFSGGI
ncbi:ABC transporter permease, partial [Paenibacillus sepulcri]|nr:ABC transporter permease [Paenibacillus sepulcri]